MELNDCINYLLTTSQNKVFKHFKHLLAPYNITPAEYGVLNCLVNRNLNTPKSIGNALYLEPSTISGILDKMSKKGLITRKTDTSNRRIVLIEETRKAYDLWPALEEAVSRLNDDCFSDLTNDERDTLKNALLKIMNSDF